MSELGDLIFIVEISTVLGPLRLWVTIVNNDRDISFVECV